MANPPTQITKFTSSTEDKKNILNNIYEEKFS